MCWRCGATSRGGTSRASSRRRRRRRGASPTARPASARRATWRARLESRAGIKLEHVPYRGGAEAARDLAAGNIAAVLITANSIKPLIDDGRAHGVALTSAERRGSLARLPTIAESGYPGYDMTSWNALFAPAGTPEPVVARLSAALHHATGDAATRERLALTGNDAVSDTPAAFAARIAREREVVKRVVRESGIRVE